MTLAEYLFDLMKNLEADIGEGQLNKADIEHIRAINEEVLAKAAAGLDVSKD